ncbi:CRISPR-associated endonuclease Cas1 [uncultured Desulfobacterium sp.]|uniref:CRISPR-associated endonuclease Cas1 n=1 Tax=uncultured Desulfobacterium sp. TaxID=201089 RepID=A0A445MTY8_9BACT|nr:CRISPR-associated endonuclease Cas1 [uncultured Desulfobacterium sp.]
MIAYVKTQGARIIQEGRHLLVRKGDTIYKTLFTYKLDQILLFGNIEVTHNAMCQIMRNNIDTVFLTRYGRYLGRLAPVEAKNVFLRKRQYLIQQDLHFCVHLAKSIVAGKLSNMATLLMRIKRSKKETEAGNMAHQIQDLMTNLSEADDINSVRGYEGRASALFFKGFPYGFVEDMGFTKRVRRPPTDPVNSVLSLLYTFLMNRVYSAVRIAGLDPYPGFLHTNDYGRFSLVLDLMEEFRTIIADTLTLSLFNLKILQKDDFIREAPPERGSAYSGNDAIADITADPIGLISMNDAATEEFDLPEQRMEEAPAPPAQVTGKYPVKLKREAFTRVIDAFEKKLTTTFHYPPAERQLTYGEAIIFQAGQFRKVIEGQIEVYQPILLR